MALSYMAADHVRTGELVPILDAYLPPSEPIQLVYPQSKLVAPKIRAFLDFASDRLQAAIKEIEIGG